MTVLLLCLMAYQVTGETLHEWFGIGMTVLLIVHHILNIKWYAALFKGKYHTVRIITTVVNVLLMASILLTALCGMAMSGHAVPFMYGFLPVSFARRFHLSMSFWSFVLMGLHLGLHIPIMTAGLKWSGKLKTALAVVFSVIAGVGFWLMIKNGIPDYLFFRIPFAFLDYEKAGVLIFAENLAMLISFCFVGAGCVVLIKGIKGRKTGVKGWLIPLLLLLASLVIGGAFLLFSKEQTPASPSWNVPSPQPVSTVSSEASQTDRSSSKASVPKTETSEISDGFVRLTGGSFWMGSPETENWRIEDEAGHEVTVSSFYLSPYETTQEEYTRLMGNNPAAFRGEQLPVESISWLDAVQYANAKSAEAGLTPAYRINNDSVDWDRSANGYRLPTEAEWEYACRCMERK